MNSYCKKFYFFCLIIFANTAINPAALSPLTDTKKILPEKSSSTLLKKYALSLAIGTTIGTIIGVTNSIFDTRYKFESLFSWFFACCAREAIVNIIVRDMEQNNIAYERYFIETSAWIVSWISYIQYNKYLLTPPVK